MLLQDPSGVTGLSWEHPVLAASFARGQVALLDAEAAMAQHGQQQLPAGGGSSAPVRWLAGGGGGGADAASCVALGEQWLAAGLDTAVATWDFRHALEAEQQAAALRARKAQKRAARSKGGGAPKGGRPRQ